MKKGFVIISILLMLALAGSIPVKADDVVVDGYYNDNTTLTSEQISNLQNTSLLLEYLRNGGTIDIKNTSDNYSVSDLLNDFGDFVRDVVEVGIDIINPFQTEIEYHGLQPIRLATPTIFEFLGVLPFYALQSEEIPEPPPDYNSLLNRFGTSYIFNDNLMWWNYQMYVSQYNYQYQVRQYNVDSTDLTFLHDCSYFTGFQFDTNNADIIISPTIANINVDSTTNSYTITNFTLTPILRGVNKYTSPGFNHLYFPHPSNDYILCNNWALDNVNTFNPVRQFNDFNTMISYIAQHFRHCNLYVDGDIWVQITNDTNYNIEISTGTVVPSNDPDTPNGKVRWEYDTYIYYDIDLIEQELFLLLEEIRSLNHPTVIRFDDLKDVIVDVNGQPAVAVKVLDDPRNIDEIYIDNYGPIVPLFVPLFTPVINDSDILNIATTPMQAIPQDIIDVFAYIFIGGLFVCFIHRLLE